MEKVCRCVFVLGMFWTSFLVSYWLQEYKIEEAGSTPSGVSIGSTLMDTLDGADLYPG
jgi:hypothetical protein